jgi:molybdopterin molybdotransferase
MERLLAIRDRLLSGLSAVGEESLHLSAAGGRRLAAPSLARRAAPPFTCSAMDGYAVRAAEVAAGTSLPVAFEVFAGDVPGALPPRSAARILTGGPLPAGADAVAPDEVVEAAGAAVSFRHPLRAGANVRPEGEDLPAGGEALPAGARLGPRQLALLSAVGVEAVAVVRRPRVAVISTGDEVVAGHIPDSNGTAVAGLCEAAGAEVERLRVADRLPEVVATLGAALDRCDAVLTIGGVSVGDRDLVPVALGQLGVEVLVHGVPMKPGKPFLFGRRGQRIVCGLPGSPSACLVAFEVFARPALLALAGARGPDRLRQAVRLPLAEPAQGRPGRARLLWAKLEADGRVRPMGRDSAQVRGPALGDALICFAADDGDHPEGALVTTWLLGDG